MAQDKRNLGIAGLVALLLAGYLAWNARPAAARAQPQLVTIAPGLSRWRIAATLAQSGAVHSAAVFEAWSLLHRRQSLKAGTYRFAGGESLPAVFNRLARGEVYALTVVVPEGYNRFDIARELGGLGLAAPAAFLQATADPASVRDLDPQAVSLEGFLFPATYHVTPGESPAQIAARMTRRFRGELRDEARLGVPPPADLHRWVTLASLVEKETAVAAERPLIAGVFANRLRRGVALQCDPTVIYAALLAHRYTGAIHRADLDFASPYNTYRRVGLPPGPIANPGRAALRAAAQPAATPYLYFVSDGQGQHRFARTLAEHERNVRLYLRAESLRGYH